MMNEKNEHKRILLNKNASGKVEFCEACDIVELELGAISLRLHAEDVSLFSTLIHEAKERLQFYKAEKAYMESNVVSIKSVH